MKQYMQRIIVCSAALLVPALGSAQDLEFGAELYVEFCANCHGDDVDGLQNFADSKDEFLARLEGETDDMPDFSDFFDPEEIDAMYDYLNSMTKAD